MSVHHRDPSIPLRRADELLQKRLRSRKHTATADVSVRSERNIVTFHVARRVFIVARRLSVRHELDGHKRKRKAFHRKRNVQNRHTQRKTGNQAYVFANARKRVQLRPANHDILRRETERYRVVKAPGRKDRKLAPVTLVHVQKHVLRGMMGIRELVTSCQGYELAHVDMRTKHHYVLHVGLTHFRHARNAYGVNRLTELTLAHMSELTYGKNELRRGGTHSVQLATLGLRQDKGHELPENEIRHITRTIWQPTRKRNSPEALTESESRSRRRQSRRETPSIPQYPERRISTRCGFGP